MSVFQVTLNNAIQGALDVYPVSSVMTQPDDYTGVAATSAGSLQRTIFIDGPHRTHRQLHDGDVFTDTNYYKRYCPYDATTNPQGERDPAKVILTCVTDDGSVWDDASGGAVNAPEVYAFDSTDGSTGGWSTVAGVITQGAGGTTYAANTLDILTCKGGYAQFCEIQNLNASAGDALQVRLNGSTSAVFTIAGGDHQIFDKGDLLISKIELMASGSGVAVSAQVILGIAAKAVS